MKYKINFCYPPYGGTESTEDTELNAFNHVRSTYRRQPRFMYCEFSFYNGRVEVKVSDNQTGYELLATIERVE